MPLTTPNVASGLLHNISEPQFSHLHIGSNATKILLILNFSSHFLPLVHLVKPCVPLPAQVAEPIAWISLVRPLEKAFASLNYCLCFYSLCPGTIHCILLDCANALFMMLYSCIAIAPRVVSHTFSHLFSPHTWRWI